MVGPDHGGEMTVRRGGVLAATLMTLALGCPAPPEETAVSEPADLVIVDAVVRTMDAANPMAEALAMRGGQVVYVGDRAGAEAHVGDGTEVVEAGGRLVLPGLIDSHAHFLGLGKTLVNLDLTGTTSAEQVRLKVVEACAAAPAGQWIYGRGWDQNDWEARAFPTWRDLHGCPDNPVYLSRVDGHALWVNAEALKAAGIHKGTPDPDGGRVVRDAQGIPSGILVDNAEALVEDVVPAATHEQLLRRARLAQAECLRLGLTGVADAGVDEAGFAAYEALGGAGELKIRVYAMVQHDEALIESWLARGPQVGLHGDHLTVRAIKLYVDGALGSRGAALLAPYSDEPGNSGLLVTEPAEIEAITRRALGAGFQVCTHAIGDRGNRVVLDAYEAALADHAGADRRLRVEHAQILGPADLPRFAALGVIPAMQPTHATSDMPWAADRLGADRLAGAYAWRSLLDSGAALPLGSDFPVESPAPLWGIHAAVTRQDHAGQPEGGWLPDQRLTVQQAVHGFTLGAAHAAFEEDRKGSLVEGKLADLVMLSRDIFEVPPAEILQTEVVLTVIGGEVLYDGR
jgi:predicted amidohydrolase YtcJ